MNLNSTSADNILQNKFLLENIQGGIVYSDFEPPFHLRYCTDGMAKLAGYTPDELVKLTQVDIVMEEDLPGLIEDINRQFEYGDTFEVEYRLKRKDGSFVHVLDRAKVVEHEDGKKYIHCLLTDISDLKKLEKELRLNQKKYQILIEQSGKVICEHNTKTNNISFSENYESIFGYKPPIGTFQDILNNGWIPLEYKTSLMELVKKVTTTMKACSIELQIQVHSNELVWCQLHLIPLIEHDNLYSIIATLENINIEKSYISHLTELSEKDSLTGVYNRYAVEKYVKHALLNFSKELYISALLVLDIDFLKKINDRNGHEFGDDVLIRVSSTIGKLLPKNSVLGRIGGDEFLVFVTTSDIQELEELANKMVCGVREISILNPKKITISIGIALVGSQNDVFQQLYRNADKALYQTKEKGKNGYTIFNQDNF